MVKWNYIAKRIADEFSSPGYWKTYSENYLIRIWNSLFQFEVERYEDRFTMSGNYALLYNFVMTLANRPEWDDKKKVDAILVLLHEFRKEGINGKEVADILERGGFDTKELPLDVGFTSMVTYQFHPQIRLHCSELLEQRHYPQCINEACKAYNDAVKKKSGSSKDGRDLMLSVWGKEGNLRVNAYDSESAVNVHEGIKFISAGLMAGLRNPTAHTPALGMSIAFEECVEILALASYLFRQLDNSMKV